MSLIDGLYTSNDGHITSIETKSQSDDCKFFILLTISNPLEIELTIQRQSGTLKLTEKVPRKPIMEVFLRDVRSSLTLMILA